MKKKIRPNTKSSSAKLFNKLGKKYLNCNKITLKAKSLCIYVVQYYLNEKQQIKGNAV